MFQDINVQELLELQKKGKLTLIDVRSPGEYEEFTIPGSVNIPFFTNEERAEIGTMYKQVSIQAAKDRGLEVMSAKLPAFVKQFEAVEGRKAVYCWRGGMRSRTTATVLSLMDIHVYRLAGGIRAYRKWVVETLADFRLHPRCVVINGYTGTGKTALLRMLADQGYPVIDLEALAGHRGSIFGQIGLLPNNQKSFESMLLHQLLQYQDKPFILMEAESKRIGRCVMPDFLVDAKEKGFHLFLDMPKEERVKHILDDYKPQRHKQACLEAFRNIKKRMHTPVAAEIEQHMQENRFSEAVGLLLEHYYDPRYRHAGTYYESEPVICKVRNINDAAERIKQQLRLWFPSEYPIVQAP